MTRSMMWSAVSVAAIVFSLGIACSNPEAKRAESKTEELKRETAEALDTVKEHSEEAWEELKDATWNRRDEYKSVAKDHTSKLGHELEELGSKVKEKTGDGADEVKKQWEKLTSDRTALERQIDRLGDATETGWDASRNAVRDSFAKIRKETKELKDKID